MPPNTSAQMPITRPRIAFDTLLWIRVLVVEKYTSIPHPPTAKHTSARGYQRTTASTTTVPTKTLPRKARISLKFNLTFSSTQRYCCVVVPVTVNLNGVWNVLPPGVHDATLDEIQERFATSEKRRKLFDGFRRAVVALVKAGCRTIYLDGSFITDKPVPGDFDVCWDPAGVDAAKLDPVFLDFRMRRKRQKEMFGGEFFPSGAKANATAAFLDFFQTDKHTGRAKGIIKLQR